VKHRSGDGKIIFLDDYGHHPTEVKAVLAAAREFWNGRIITVFQPHRYSRTLHCKEEFCTAFYQSDILYLVDIYAAGEDPIPGVSSEILAKGIGKAMGSDGRVRYLPDIEAVLPELLLEIKEGDLVICLGAGSITRLADQLRVEWVGLGRG
jgi:UDP-N-acetylmuramate--alanine ligase